MSDHVVIQAAHYGETVAALKADPIIINMAHTISLADCEGTGLMMPALHEYNRRGGEVATHIGGPAEAIRQIVKAREGAAS